MKFGIDRDHGLANQNEPNTFQFSKVYFPSHVIET